MDIHVIAGHKFKLAVLLSFTILLIALGVGNIILGDKVADVHVLNENWTVSENGGPSRVTSLSDFKFSARNRLDVIEMSCILPDYFDEAYTIMPTIYLCSVEVYVDGELIYTYGTECIAQDRMIGSGTYFVNIPEGSAGKKLSIRFVQNEKNGSTAILPIRAVPTGEQYHELLVEKLFIFTVSLLLIGIGFMFWCNGIILAFFNRLFTRLATIGSLSMVIGIWAFISSQSSALFVTSNNVRVIHTSAEYLFLYLGPVVFAVMMYQLTEIKEKWRRKTMIGICIWCALFFCITVLLHVTNTFRFPTMLNLYHANSIVCMIIAFSVAFLHHEEHSNSEKLFIFSLSLLAVVLVLDIARFNYLKYIHQPQFEIISNFLPVGMLQFVVLAFIGFLVPIYDKAMTMDEKNLLSRLAYTDSLTGLSNRTKCYEMFRVLDRSDADYVLINFDVNGLKFINDTCGHQVGDKLLTVFATCLQDSFGDIGRCFRMGGDEFLVLIQTESADEVQSAMKTMQYHAASRSRLWSFSLRYAYGIACRSDVSDGLAKSVYELSDARMYEMKTTDESSRTFSEIQYYEKMRNKDQKN